VYSSPLRKQWVATTFHQSGVASKSAVTRGVPRLRELLKVTQNPKATSLTIYLKPEYRNNKDKAREVVQDLELTLLRNITNTVGIYWDNQNTTIVDDDKELMEFYKIFNERQDEEEKKDDETNKWLLRLELNREEMFNRNISIYEVVSVIKLQFGQNIGIVYSDYNSSKLVVRIQIPSFEGSDNDMSKLDHFTHLKKFQNKLLNSIVIRGYPGIKAVTFRNDKQYVEEKNASASAPPQESNELEQKDESKEPSQSDLDNNFIYEQIDQFVLDTDGSNFIQVMNHSAVDGTKLYSTNVWDIYDVLGIEATRTVLLNEINTLFESVGVNYRHLCLLCDVITRSGRLMSIDRYGINKNDIGTLAKASFEETEKILLKAAIFGDMDPVTGVSANVMFGQAIRGGTAFSQILMDEQMMYELLRPIDVKESGDKEEDTDLNKLNNPEGRLNLCSKINLQSNIDIPHNATKHIEDETDIEFTIV
jgi:DNA-directed RNA polymerase II subunit RPB1